MNTPVHFILSSLLHFQQYNKICELMNQNQSLVLDLKFSGVSVVQLLFFTSLDGIFIEYVMTKRGFLFYYIPRHGLTQSLITLGKI